jgi:hypothetical protein
MMRLFLVGYWALILSHRVCVADLVQKITKDEVRMALSMKNPIVDALVKESHLVAIGKKSEGTVYELKILEILSSSDLIQTGATRDYEKIPVLKKNRRYLLIISAGGYHAEEWKTSLRRAEIINWISEIIEK